MMIYVVMLSLMIMINSQVSHDVIQPSVSVIKIGKQVISVSENSAFRQSFTLLGYDIGGRVYQTNQGILDTSIFDKSMYTRSTSCTLYKSEQNFKLLDRIKIEEEQEIQELIPADNLGMIFAIKSNTSYQSDQQSISRYLISYSFNQSSLSSSSSQKIQLSDLGLNSSQSLDIKLILIQQRLILTDGVIFVNINAHNFSQHKIIDVVMKQGSRYDYQFARENVFVKMELCHYDRKEKMGIVLVVWNKAIRVFGVKGQGQGFVLEQEFVMQGDKEFSDAVADHGSYYAIAQGTFIAYRRDKQGKYQPSTVMLQSSQCHKLNKYRSTIHIICSQSGLKYTAQYYLNQSFVDPSQALHLNRYYNQIQDARLLFRFGEQYNPRLAIIGDYDLILVPYAINRKVLLQSPYAPRFTRLRSFGLQLIHSLHRYSNFTHNYALGVGQYFIALFLIVQTPPQMQCLMMHTNTKRQYNLLVQLNTSSCVANGDWQQLQSICTYYFPFNIYASLVEVDQANHKTIVGTVLLLLLAIAIMIVGCGLYCKNNVERAAREIRKKIEEIKKKKQASRPI